MAKLFSLKASSEMEEARPFFNTKPLYILGLDEVGRGSLAGPVVAAAYAYSVDAAWISQEPAVRVWDSKKLSSQHREATDLWLRSISDSYFGIAEESPEKIDEINILQASLRAMEEAYRIVIAQIKQRCSEFSVWVRVDGNQMPRLLAQKNPHFRADTCVGGDAKSFAIAAASILAKEYRDRLMHQWDLEYPHYGWKSNVGYGTEVHRKAIESHGLSPLHRRSFCSKGVQ